MTRLDHGTLTTSLAARGDIDAQIDRYKREQVAKVKEERKTKAQEVREAKAAAKDALSAILAVPGLVESKAAKMGVTVRYLRAELTSWSKWEPARLCKPASEWL
jgi:hypothetical protein